MPMPTRGKLRKREILFAVTMGVLATGGAALVLSDGGPGTEPPPVTALAAPQTYELGEFTEISTVGPQDVVVTLGGSFRFAPKARPRRSGCSKWWSTMASWSSVRRISSGEASIGGGCRARPTT